MSAIAKPIDPQGKATARSPIRVLLVLGALDGGGAERVAITLAQACDPAEVDIRFGLLRRRGAYLAAVDAGRIAAARNIVGMIREARPEVVMSFGMGVNLLTALAMARLGRRRPRWICREDSNTDAEIAGVTGSRIGRRLIWAAVSRAYRSADLLLGVSRDLARRLETRLGLRPGAMAVVHNPIDTGHIARAAACAEAPEPPFPSRPFAVAAGRLTRQKGFDLLIEGFAASKAARGHDLVILGVGPLEAELRARAIGLGLGERVVFAGFQANPWAWFGRARLFVLPSRWEGFGNVVAEAMACGAPVLAADCDFGPREQIEHATTGWLVAREDSAALAEGLDRLLTDSDLTARLAEAGQTRAAAFDAAPIARTYDALFVALARRSGERPAGLGHPDRLRAASADVAGQDVLQAAGIGDQLEAPGGECVGVEHMF